MRVSLRVLHSLRVLFRYRHRVLEGVIHDIRQRYIGSAFGSLWVFLFPFLQLGIYAGLYSFIFKIRVSGLTEMGYVVLVFSGLVPLMAFNEALTAATSSLSANKNLLLNTVFPAELIPVRAALSAHVTSLIGLSMTLIVGFALGRTSWQAILLVPIFWVLLLMFAMGIGWMFSLFSLVSRDIQHGLGLVTMLLFVLSPFAYTPEMVPTALKPLIYLNPLSYFVLTFQQLICYGTWPDPVAASGAIVLGVGSFFVGFNVFQRAKYVFFDYA
jgi:lipopolysaccharide transport system permease protein